MAKGGTLRVRVLGDTGPFEKKLKGLSGTVGKTFGTIAKVGGAALLGAGAAAVTGAFKVAAFGDEIAKSAGKAGIGAEQFQELRFAFGQGGVEAATMDTALMKFNKRLGESATTGGTADEAFEALGVSLRDASGNVRDSGETLDEILPKLGAIESDAERAAIAGDLFGQRAGPELAAALADGTEGIDAAREKAQELGIVMGEDAAEAAEKFTDQWDDIKQSTMGLVREGLIPVMEVLSDKIFPAIQDGIGRMRELWDIFEDGQGIVGGLKDVFSELFSGGGGLFSGLIDMAKEAFANLVEWLTSGGMETIFTAILESRERLFNAAMQLFPVIIDALVQVVPKLLETITGTVIPQLIQLVVTQVPKLLDAAMTLFQALIDAVVQVLPPLLETLAGTVLPNVLTTILGMIPALLKAGIEAFTALVDAVIEILPDLLNTLLGTLLPDVLKAIVRMLPRLLEAAIEAFMALVDGVIEVLPVLLRTLLVDVLPALLDALIEMIPQLLTTAVDVFMALVDAVIEVLPELLGVIATEVIPALVEAVLKAVPKLFTAGVEVVKGLWEGLKSMGPWLIRKITAWALDVLPGPIAKVLGIKSPSKVFAEMGRNLGKGLVVGIDGSRRMVEASAKKLSEAARVESSATLSSMTGVGGSSPVDSRLGGQGSRQVIVNIHGDVAKELDEERLVTLLRRAELLRG